MKNIFKGPRLLKAKVAFVYKGSSVTFTAGVVYISDEDWESKFKADCLLRVGQTIVGEFTWHTDPKYGLQLKLNKVVNYLDENGNKDKLVTYLHPYKLSEEDVALMNYTTGSCSETLNQLLVNPYKLSVWLPEVSFKKIDPIILDTVDLNEEQLVFRQRACFYHILSCNFMGGGDCWAYLSDVIRETNKTLKRSGSTEFYTKLVDEDTIMCFVDANKDRVTKKGHKAAAGRIHATLLGSGPRDSVGLHSKYDGNVWSSFDRITEPLNKGQLDAVNAIMDNAVTIVSGGAGSGKTYIIGKIIELGDQWGFTCKLLAPTGKAARRMSEVTGKSASTIHKELKFTGTGFSRDFMDKIPESIVIVDEISMVDIFLFNTLLKYIDLTATRLVLIGDHHQLPPVGPGCLLRDFIDYRFIPTVVLTEAVRQAGVLKQVCNRILAKEVVPSVDSDLTPDSVYFVKYFDEKLSMAEYVVDFYINRFPTEFGGDMYSDIQILSPMKTLEHIGMKKLNITIQEIVQLKKFGVKVNRDAKGRRTQKLYVGDKVMCIRNNYTHDIMNGTLGCVTNVIYKNKSIFGIEVYFETGSTLLFKKEDGSIHDLDLAYVITIHKSQGSEYPYVVLLIHPEQGRLLYTNLIYTGVTRAKKTAIVLCDPAGYATAILKDGTDRRKTILSSILAKNMV